MSSCHFFTISVSAKGVIKGARKFDELYAYIYSPAFLVLHIFCPGRSGSCVRAMTSALRKHLLPQDIFKDCKAADASDAFDKLFIDLLAPPGAADTLHQAFLAFGLYKHENDFATLSQNACRDRRTDEITSDFSVGEKCSALFTTCEQTMLSISHLSLIAELTFSFLKSVEGGVHMSNETTNASLEYMTNTLHDLREERRKLVKHCKNSSKASGTFEQVATDVEQLCTSILPIYTPGSMMGIPSRESLRGTIKSSDSEVASSERALRLNSEARSSAHKKDWAQVVDKTSKEKTYREAQLVSIESSTDGDRRLCVVLGKRFPNQPSLERTFWSKIDAMEVLKDELGLCSPIVHRMVDVLLRDKKTEVIWDPKRKVQSTKRITPLNQRKYYMNSLTGLLKVLFDVEDEERKNPKKSEKKQLTEKAYKAQFCARCRFAHFGGLLCFLDRSTNAIVTPFVLLRMREDSLHIARTSLIQKTVKERMSAEKK